MALILPEFIERRLPEKYSRGAEWDYVFSTEVVDTNEAFEYRNASWDTYRGQGRISHLVKNTADFEELRDFGVTLYGQAVGFRFRDWSAYKTTRPSYIQRMTAGDGFVGTTNPIQLKLTHRRVYRGQAQGPNAVGDIRLAAVQNDSLDHDQDDAYNDMIIRIASGAGAGQMRYITDYLGASKVASVAPDWATIPDSTSIYEIEEGIFQKTILKPAKDVPEQPVEIFANDLPKAGTIVYETGVFTPSAAWTDLDVVSASFAWDWPVRMSSDFIKSSFRTVKHRDWRGLELIELLNP